MAVVFHVGMSSSYGLTSPGLSARYVATLKVERTL